MGNLVIHNGTVITMGAANRVIANGAVAIRAGKIVAVGPGNAIKKRFRQFERLDARGGLIMPGAICAHTHFYGAFARGMAIPGAPARNFVEVLKKLWWKLDRALDLDGVRYSTLVCLADAIKNGTTTLIDHHASPNAIEGSLDTIANALFEAGLRGALCYEVTDRNGLEGAHRGLFENAFFAQSSRSDTLGAAIGVHASFTVSDRTLDACVRAAADLNAPLHIHVAEDAADEAHCLRVHGKRVVKRLADAGALNQRAMLAHCIHIDASEMRLIAKHGAKVMHQPRSNMNNGVGVAPVQRMLDAGICVGLGNDGFSNDVFAEMKVCDMLHKVSARDPRAMGADKIVRMAYHNNAEIAQLFWPDQRLGALQAGAAGDVIVVDYTPFTRLDAGNLPWHMLFGMSGGMVTDTVCNGRVLMRARQLLTLDEGAIAAGARRAADRTWARVGSM